MAKPRHQKQAKKPRNPKVYKPFEQRADVGGLPGHVQASGPTHPTSVHVFTFDHSTYNEHNNVNQLFIDKLVDKPGQITWIDVCGLADSAFIECLGKRFQIHPLLLEDIVHTHQRPKVEIYDDRVALILRLVESTAPLAWEQVSFVLCGATVLTFQERPGDAFDPIRKRIRNRLGSIGSLGADYTMYSLIDVSIDSFFPLMEDYGKTLEDLEDAIEQGIGIEVQNRVHSIRTELSQLRKISWAQREAIQRLIADADDLFQPATLPFLRDCLDHTGQLLDVSETFRDMAGDLRDHYFTQLSQRTNDVMKLLTIISTVFMPLSFIAGVYGMNFNSEISRYNMPETQWYLGYPVVMLLMMAIAAMMLFYFYRKGWLPGR